MTMERREFHEIDPLGLAGPIRKSVFVVGDRTSVFLTVLFMV